MSGYIGNIGFRDITPMIEYQLDRDMENAMETGSMLVSTMEALV